MFRFWLIPLIPHIPLWRPARISQAFWESQLIPAPLEKRKDVYVNYVCLKKFCMSSQLGFSVQIASDLTKYLIQQNTKLQNM